MYLPKHKDQYKIWPCNLEGQSMKNQQGSCDLQLTHTHRRETRTLGSAEALKSRKLRFVARTVKSWPFGPRNTTTGFISHFFIVFAVLPDINPSWLTDWITFIGLQYPKKLGSGEMTIFYCSNGQQTDLLTIRATFLQIKLRSSELEGAQQWVNSGKLW